MPRSASYGRQVELEDASPFDAAPAARAEHAARLSEAQVALREGRAARVADASRAAVREDVTIRGGERFGDDDLGRQASGVAAEARGRPGRALPRRGPGQPLVSGEEFSMPPNRGVRVSPRGAYPD